MATVSQLFTANGNWTCPSGVSAVWLTAIGGGSGTPASNLGQGGAGSAEMVVNRLIPVVPTTVYAVVIGTKGIHSTLNTVLPTLPTGSSFNGFKALGGGALIPVVGFSQPQHSGFGGGVNGGFGMSNGAYVGTPFGRQEAGSYFGGNSGSGGYGYPMPVQGAPGYTPSVTPVGFNGSHGGKWGRQGVGVTGDGNATGGGGAGGGTVWGAMSGLNGEVQTVNCPATYYGAGAGGNGSNHSIPGNGNDGAPGAVLLMWAA